MRSFLLCVILLLHAIQGSAQIKKENLIQPAELAAILSDPLKPKPVIFNIGPVGDIEYSERGGTVSTEEGFKKFKILAGYHAKTEEIILYCGCCTLDNCPNIRLAFDYLVSAGFKNVKVLDLPVGLAEDWTSKGYPMK